MDKFDNNSQQIGNNDKVKTFQPKIFSVEENAVNNNSQQQQNQNQPTALPELR